MWREKKESFGELWKVSVIPKAAHLVWRLFSNGVAIKVNLQRRNVHIGEVSCP